MVAIVFYVLGFLTILAGFCVITVRNPVHSVLWLIVAFFSCSGLFILLGAEFLAMLLMIVYVGAVAVLFLFVVMMLDVDFAELKKGFARYLPLALFIGLLLIVELGIVTFNWNFSNSFHLNLSVPIDNSSNTVALGKVVYTDFIHLFQSAGLILLVAMIGAIVLTLRHKTGVKRQNIVSQVHRDSSKSIDLIDVKPGQGL